MKNNDSNKNIIHHDSGKNRSQSRGQGLDLEKYHSKIFDHSREREEKNTEKRRGYKKKKNVTQMQAISVTQTQGNLCFGRRRDNHLVLYLGVRSKFLKKITIVKNTAILN